MKVEILRVDDVLPIRHEVLWPDKPLSFSKVVDDHEGEHFGIRHNGKIICVVSMFSKGNEVRLRKFATVEDFHGKGFGTYMLKYLIDRYKREGKTIFWFDARESALAFYEKFGFSIEGERLYKSDVPYFKMVKTL